MAILWALVMSIMTVCVSAQTPVDKAATMNSPIVLFCLKEKGCPWSTLWQERLIGSSALMQVLSDHATIQVAVCGEDIHVPGVRFASDQMALPLVVLLDPRGREFARLDYDGSDPEVFAMRITGVIEDFHEICLAIDQGIESVDEQRLKELYVRSARLSEPSFRKLLLAKGVRHERGVFFHLEKYTTLLETLGSKHPVVKKMRAKILARDPRNQKGVHREVAWIEFRRKVATLPVRGRSVKMVKKALSPLVAYAKKWADPVTEKPELESWIAQFLKQQDVIPIPTNQGIFELRESWR